MTAREAATRTAVTHICADCLSTNIEPFVWGTHVAVSRCCHVPLLDAAGKLLGADAEVGYCPQCPRTWWHPDHFAHATWEYAHRDGFDPVDLAGTADRPDDEETHP